MATAAEHYAEAARLARVADNYTGAPGAEHMQSARLAQVHATLAYAGDPSDVAPSPPSPNETRDTVGTSNGPTVPRRCLPASATTSATRATAAAATRPPSASPGSAACRYPRKALAAGAASTTRHGHHTYRGTPWRPRTAH